MKPVAIFDIDGTVFRSSLTIELVEGLIAHEVFSPKVREEYRREYEAWLNRHGTYEEYMYAVVEAFVRHIKGTHYEDFMRVVEDVVARTHGRVYRFTRDLIADLKAEGYYLLAVSQSPKAVLDQFCGTLGFDKTYGRFYELGPSDRFTGVVQDEHLIGNKANIVRRAVEKEGLTLEGSYGIGDTADDVAFLELVRYPICFNPNHELYQHAKLNNWRVIVERKDVIHEIQG